MKKTRITAEHFKRFKRIVQTFNNTTRLARFGRWRRMTDDEIWKAMVDQIVVVGSSAPQVKMARSEYARRELEYSHLLSLHEAKRILHVHRILREFGVRYAARKPGECKKSKAIHQNLLFLYEHGGPRRFVAELAGLETDYEKIKKVMQSCAFIKSKGARDLLIELGLVKDAIAFDVRLQQVLYILRIDVPKGFTASEISYRSVEKVLLDKICRRLNVTGSRLDRILFQHTDEIVKMFH